MIYIHYCSNCKHIYMLNGHKPNCPSCETSLTELSITYAEYTNMCLDERKHLLEVCSKSETLQSIAKPLAKKKNRGESIL